MKGLRKTKGRLFVVSAPSGAGKTTLCRQLLQSRPNMGFCVSHTTRPPRPGERDGIDYSFLSQEQFVAMRDAGEFAEWAQVHGNFYGTSRARLEGMLDEGLDVLHDIDVQGAKQMRPLYPDATYIFILPPSREALRQRLTGRGSDAPEVVERRLAKAVDEMREYQLYDYVIINDNLETALEEFRSVVEARALRIDTVEPSWVSRTFFEQ